MSNSVLSCLIWTSDIGFLRTSSDILARLRRLRTVLDNPVDSQSAKCVPAKGSYTAMKLRECMQFSKQCKEPTCCWYRHCGAVEHSRNAGCCKAAMCSRAAGDSQAAEHGRAPLRNWNSRLGRRPCPRNWDTTCIDTICIHILLLKPFPDQVCQIINMCNRGMQSGQLTPSARELWCGLSCGRLWGLPCCPERLGDIAGPAGTAAYTSEMTSKHINAYRTSENAMLCKTMKRGLTFITARAFSA